jgi:CheY-like chemotaxis protein
MRLLFADDNQETCNLFELVFRMENINAQFAHNGAEAVEAVREEAEAFDVIVLDVEMPVMNGWSALKAIRELPQGQNVPIAIFTGYVTIESKAWAKRLGAAALLFKPMLPDDMLRELRKIVEP